MEGPYIRIEDTGDVIPLADTVTTIGRGSGVNIRLADPSVSRLHAEIVRHGPYAYVADLGLSRNGTRVNGGALSPAGCWKRATCSASALRGAGWGESPGKTSPPRWSCGARRAPS